MSRICPDYGGIKVNRTLGSIAKKVQRSRIPDDLLRMAGSLVSDLGNVANAYRHICHHGGTAPGRNQLCFEGLSYQENAELVIAVRDMIRGGQYEAGPLREVRIPKVGRPGDRIISLLNLEDRIVQRAVAQVGNAYLDPQFVPTSFGYRPKKGRSHAAASAINLGLARCEYVVCQDLKDAFDHADPTRALQILTKRLPSKEFVDIARRSLTSNGKLGLRQGSPLSPLVINVFLDHFLDRPWRRRFGNWPMLRYADDILVLTNSLEEAVIADRHIRELLAPTGMIPKWPAENSIVRLEKDTDLTWLGYGITRTVDQVTIRISQKSWDALEAGLEELQIHQDPARQAQSMISGWITELGPCFENEDRPRCYERIQKLCHDLSLNLSLDVSHLEGRWLKAYERFELLRGEDSSHG